jgi:predicted adenine nucleotide alpha hydrolase (AANH) superfamily ATPase
MRHVCLLGKMDFNLGKSPKTSFGIRISGPTFADLEVTHNRGNRCKNCFNLRFCSDFRMKSLNEGIEKMKNYLF